MTDQITEQAENDAFREGRNSVDYRTRCTFTHPDLIKAWQRGRRQVLAEDRLDADTEWDLY